MRNPLVWLALGVALPIAVQAQNVELPARWMDWHVQAIDSRCAGDKELSAQMVGHLKKIVRAFLKANPGYPSAGYADAHLIPLREMPPFLKGGCEANPLRGDVDILVSAENQVVFGAAGKGRPTGRKYDTEGGIGGFWLSVNRVPTHGTIDALSSLRDLNNTYWVMTQSMPTSTFEGYPVLNHTDIVIAPPGYPPLYIPVPIEQALKLALPGAEQDVASWVEEVKKEQAKQAPDSEESKAIKALLKSATPEQRRQMQDVRDESLKVFNTNLREARAKLDLLKARLAKLTAANKGAAAFWKDDLPQAEADEGAQALVTINPAYFDKRLSRSVPQLLVIGGFDDTKLDRQETVGDRKAVQRVDWKALSEELLR